MNEKNRGITFSMKEGLDFGDLATAMSGGHQMPAADYLPNSPADDMLADLYAWLEGDYEELVFDPRTPGLHASSLWKTCARREVISVLFNDYNKPYPQTAGNKFTQDLGHSLHQWWQERYLGPHGILLGRWHCVGCDTVTEGKMPLNCPCGTDWRDAVRYLETRVSLKDIKVDGACDGILQDARTGKKRVFEFKSKSTNQYRMIHAPTFDHIIQVHVYMKGLGLDEAIIVYQDKGKSCSWSFNKGNFKAGKPNIKAYLVKFDEALWAETVKIVEEYHASQVYIEAELKGNKKTVSEAEEILHNYNRVCSSESCNLAKSCHVAKKCFSNPPHAEGLDV